MGLADELTSTLDNERVGDIWTPLIDWAEFWTRERADEDWVAWPLIPKGRQTALYAPAKSAKSWLVLAVVAAVATGRDVLGQRNHVGPQHVLYLDYEMTEDDLHERLEELGYGPEDDLSHLHYALLPSLPPLNTDEGASAVLGLASAVEAVVVVVDTTGRAVWGEENTNDTYRDFAQTTGYLLKQAGIAVLRTDHAGKDSSKGQRGASAKNDDVDLVMRVEAVQDGLVLHRTHSRIGWAPARVQIARVEHDDITSYVVSDGERPYAEGTKDLVAELRALGVDAYTSNRVAQSKLREATGRGAKTGRVADALRWMKAEVSPFGETGNASRTRETNRETPTYPQNVHSGKQAEATTDLPGRETPGNAGKQEFGQVGNGVSTYKVDTVPSPGPETPPEQSSKPSRAPTWGEL